MYLCDGTVFYEVRKTNLTYDATFTIRSQLLFLWQQQLNSNLILTYIKITMILTDTSEAAIQLQPYWQANKDYCDLYSRVKSEVR